MKWKKKSLKARKFQTWIKKKKSKQNKRNDTKTQESIVCLRKVRLISFQKEKYHMA